MLLSKRQFIKLGMGGTAAIYLAPVLKPRSLFANSVVLPANYLDTSAHQQWMKLSYNQGQESRRTRRNLGALLRNLGATRGKGRGYAFALSFDQAIGVVYQRWMAGSRKPGSLLELIQALYDEFIFPQKGSVEGLILFRNLFAVLRGRDGTDQGEAARRSYLAYREALLNYKNAYRIGRTGEAIEAARRTKTKLLRDWQAELEALAEAYALQRRRLNGQFPIEGQMLEGYSLSFQAVRLSAPQLRISHSGDQIRVTWDGEGKLQRAPTVNGPWTDVPQNSPAMFDLRENQSFFRTVNSQALSRSVGQSEVAE